MVETTQLMFAQTSWPDAALGIAGTALVGTVVVVIIWQALQTWRARFAVTREQAYRELAEQTAEELRRLNRRLDTVSGGSPEAEGDRG